MQTSSKVTATGSARAVRAGRYPSSSQGGECELAALDKNGGGAQVNRSSLRSLLPMPRSRA